MGRGLLIKGGVKVPLAAGMALMRAWVTGSPIDAPMLNATVMLVIVTSLLGPILADRPSKELAPPS